MWAPLTPIRRISTPQNGGSAQRLVRAPIRHSAKLNSESICLGTFYPDDGTVDPGPQKKRTWSEYTIACAGNSEAAAHQEGAAAAKKAGPTCRKLSCAGSMSDLRASGSRHSAPARFRVWVEALTWKFQGVRAGESRVGGFGTGSTIGF